MIPRHKQRQRILLITLLQVLILATANLFKGAKPGGIGSRSRRSYFTKHTDTDNNHLDSNSNNNNNNNNNEIDKCKILYRDCRYYLIDGDKLYEIGYRNKSLTLQNVPPKSFQFRGKDELLDVEGLYGVYKLEKGAILAVLVQSDEVYNLNLCGGTNNNSTLSDSVFVRASNQIRGSILLPDKIKSRASLRQVTEVELIYLPDEDVVEIKAGKRKGFFRRSAATPVSPFSSMSECGNYAFSNESLLSKSEQRQLQFLRKTFKSHSLYYSPAKYSLNLAMNSLQRCCCNIDDDRDGDESSVDSRFYWNELLVDLFRNLPEMNKWIIPCTSAFVGVQKNVLLETSTSTGETIDETQNNSWIGYWIISKIQSMFLSKEEKQQIQDSNKSKKSSTIITYDQLLISRRSKFRAGTRFTRRGADEDGQVANFVETEQILLVKEGDKKSSEEGISSSSSSSIVDIHSYVQTRGSIPLVWSSPAHPSTYTPRVCIETNPLVQARTLRSHVFDQLEYYTGYKVGRSVNTMSHTSPILTMVNLIDKKGDQGRLGRTWESVLSALLDVHDSEFHEKGRRLRHPRLKQLVRFTWFDFHAECSSSNGGWDNLKKLLESVEGDMDKHEYLSIGIDRQQGDAAATTLNVLSSQKGIVRTNCMDCLDRTNVVQTIIGRKAVFRQLQNRKSWKGMKLRTLPLNYIVAYTKKDILHLPWLEGETAHRHLWADNADFISRLYSGTNALKRDYTRTGQRTKLGALDDGINSLTRYYINNFIDAARQEGVDLFTGIIPFEVDNEEELSALQKSAHADLLKTITGDVDDADATQSSLETKQDDIIKIETL